MLILRGDCGEGGYRFPSILPITFFKKKNFSPIKVKGPGVISSKLLSGYLSRVFSTKYGGASYDSKESRRPGGIRIKAQKEAKLKGNLPWLGSQTKKLFLLGGGTTSPAQLRGGQAGDPAKCRRSRAHCEDLQQAQSLLQLASGGPSSSG